MSAPIRDMADLVEGVRSAQLERELSDQLLEALAGVASGSVAKYIGPKPCKRLGPVSTFPLLGALGKALIIVDDPEQIERMQKRWTKRKIVGGSARQIRLRTASLEHVKREGIPIKPELADAFARMQMLGQAGGKASGKTRRAKAAKRRELKAKRAKAAKMRWAKQASAL